MAKKKVKVENFIPLVEAIYVLRSPVTEDEKASLRREAEENWVQQSTHYGYTDPRPSPVDRKLDAITNAVDRESAIEARQRCKETTEAMILGAWARGKIQGPVSEYSIEKEIKKHQGLLGLLELKDNRSGIECTTRRIRELQTQLENFKKE